MSKARMASIKAVYNGKDISADISKYLKSFSISEVISGEADNAEITMHDREELWQGDWMPDRGATIDISIILTDWQSELDDKVLPLGKFELDEIKNSGPPNTVQLKMVSIPNNAAIRSVEKNKAWEKTKLSVIAGDIAKESGLELFYDTQEDPLLDRAEQSEQTDLSFLMKLCKDAGLALKVSDQKIIIFDMEKYEQADVVMTIDKAKTSILSFDASSTIHDIYKACHVKSQNNKSEAHIEYTFTAPDKKEGLTLEVNEKVESIAEAEKLAKKKLREKNQEEVTMSMSLPGNFNLMAANTVQIAGFHFYDGKYIIKKSSHTIDTGGYKTKIELRRCIDGY